MKKYALVLSVFLVLLFINQQAFSEEEWQIQRAMRDNIEYKIPYKITNGTVNKIENDIGSAILDITSGKNHEGILEIILPRNFADTARIEMEDDDFFILVDGEEIDFREFQKRKSKCFRHLLISFPPNSKLIEIISSFYVTPIKTKVPPVSFTTNKNNYEAGEIIIISGCTDLSLDGKILLDVLDPNGEIYQSVSIVPNYDGSFSNSLRINDQVVDGTYTASATFSEYTTTSTFTVPEFPFGMIILFTGMILMLSVSKKINVVSEMFSNKTQS